MTYILHIERKVGKHRYRFKMEIEAASRPKAIEAFNTYADRHVGESILISCRRSDYGEPK
jgi:hypothetical protein